MNRAARKWRLIILVSVGVCVLAAGAQAQPSFCTPPYRIEWPAGNPVWTMCWLPPEASSGPDGSGLELRHVFYKGKRVFWRANVPVLNVLYDTGSGFCGPTYRDWLNEPQAFQADNVLQPGYAEPTQTPKTVCDAPGADVGSFAGVAVQKLADRLILTTQTRAGWYRYIQRITFYPDGTIEPQFGFTAVTHECINRAHTHHGYWRFDLDIEGAGNDTVRERRRFFWFFKIWSLLGAEQTRLRSSGNFRRWRVLDKETGRGVEIRPGHHDEAGGDSFGGSDLWVLRYHGNETDDGGATGGDQQHIDPYVNGESVNGQDVVLWYRVGHRHESGPSCMLDGPRLILIGNW